MALPKLFQRIFWHNSTTPAVNEDNLNAMSKGLSDVDDRLIDIAGTIMEDVPQIQEDIEELEEDFALIDEKIADATSEANRATTKADEAAASVISAGNKALISEGYAKGTQNGTPVGSSSPYYRNNAEYFKDQARSFTPEGYQDLVDDVAEAQEAITDIEGEKVSSNDAYVLRQCKGNSVDLKLVGGSVAWNQLVSNGNFANTDNWVIVNSTGNASNNKLTLTATGDSLQLFQSPSGITMPAGKKIFMTCTVTASVAKSVQLRLSQNDPIGNHKTKTVSLAANTRTVISAVFSPSVALPNVRFSLFVQSSANGEIYTVENFMAIDLTQLFGSSTIADYIYSLEQATAGAGVAWFRQYFRNLYYGYDPGSIQSVNPSKRATSGFNILDVNDIIMGFLNTSTGAYASSTNGQNWCSNNFIPVCPAGKYYCKLPDGFSTSNANTAVFEYDKNKNYIKYTDNVNSYGSTVQVSSNCYYIKYKVYFVTAQTSMPTTACINYYTESGSPKNGDYVPYEGYMEYPFDSSKQLRGIPKLVDNKLSYDGDIYTADGSITRKYGIVDLSTLTWTYYSDNNYYISDSLANVIRRVTDNASISNWLLCKTISNTANNVYLGNIGVAVASNGRLYYKDENTSSTTPPTGNLVYELATPTTESANPYQNPQRASIDGTEEFVDAGVTASTRDVSIPVGNESEYNTSVVLPISQDYTDGAMEILKEIATSSSDFADFKTRVAAL